jgi:hypothetical protein
LNSRDRPPWGFAEVPSELGAVLLAFCLATLYAYVWALFGIFLRPVREGGRSPLHRRADRDGSIPKTTCGGKAVGSWL